MPEPLAFQRFQLHRSVLEFSFLKIRECQPLSEVSSCDQSNMFDADDLPLALMCEEDVPLARLMHSDGIGWKILGQRSECNNQQLDYILSPSENFARKLRINLCGNCSYKQTINSSLDA